MNTECDLCGGTGFEIVYRPDGITTGARRCICRQPAKPAESRTPLTLEMASIYTTIILDTLAGSPGKNETVARAYINKRVFEMCDSEEQIAWLTDRACDLHTKWEDCGIRGLRQILSSNSKYLPKDGVLESWSPAYPEGIPPQEPRLAPAAKALPAGHAVSASISIEAAVSDLGEAKAIPATRGFRSVPPVARRIAEVPPNPHAPKIMRVEVEREVEKLREAKRKKTGETQDPAAS